MKKLISLLLVIVVCAAMLSSCAADVDIVTECYRRSNPYTITVTSTQQFDNDTLEHKTVLKRGQVGQEHVSVKITEGEKFMSIADGSTEVIYKYIEDEGTTLWWRENLGVSSNKGVSYDAEGEDFFPAQGEIALNLDDNSAMKNIGYESDNLTYGKLSFTVPADKTAVVFGENAEIVTDVNVVITTDTAVVKSVVIEYTVPANSSANIEAMFVKIEARYEYTPSDNVLGD